MNYPTNIDERQIWEINERHARKMNELADMSDEHWPYTKYVLIVRKTHHPRFMYVIPISIKKRYSSDIELPYKYIDAGFKSYFKKHIYAMTHMMFPIELSFLRKQINTIPQSIMDEVLNEIRRLF